MNSNLMSTAPLSAEPIAIIGIGCRFPGGANDPESFWKLLCDGIDAVTEIPSDRWNIRKFYHPDPSQPGKTYSRWGGFIHGVDEFDPSFFRISDREAHSIDPQQRLLLEVAWEALEDAGHVIDLEAGSNTGVFVGISTVDYDRLQYSILDHSHIELHSCTGNAVSIAANRISYCLNLRGPSVAVDTACSSSLVAVHLACRSLRDRECTLALAGGVNLILRVEPFIGFSKAAMLSPDGRCKSFSADANGYVRSEGAGMILLKPLQSALADSDPIYAVIRGTAINEDGRTRGIAMPSRRAQESVVRETCRVAGVSPGLLRYVEAHGTGTAAGDPIEINALGAALSQDRIAGNTCYVGSVKSNLGHLESAAGMPGIIKAALVLQHRLVPPNLHFDRPNPRIDFYKHQLRVPTTLQPLTGDGGPLFAGVNSFGFGGTNAHAVLEAPPNQDWHADSAGSRFDGSKSIPQVVPGNRPSLLPLSAHTPEALRATARAYIAFLQPDGKGCGFDLPDICYTASQRKRHHEHRLSVVGHCHEELAGGLGAFLAGESSAAVSSGQRVGRRRPKLAFAFGGQGSQWWAMGRGLLDDECGHAVFRDRIAECDRVFRSIANGDRRSLWDEFHAAEADSRIHEVATSLWAIFSVQIATAALWISWGVEPDAVVGHSTGEIAAAHVAGILSLEDAGRLIFHRGRCMEELGVTGKMLAAGLSREQAQDLVAHRGHGVWLAAINSFSSVTLSGDPAVLEDIARDLRQQQVFCKFLRVSFPFHSGQLEPMKEDFRASLHDLTPQRAATNMISTVTGHPVVGPELDADYWWLNARHPVQFGSAMSALIDGETEIFLEISPHPVLAGSIHECLRDEGRKATVVTSLRRGELESAVMLRSLGALFSLGLPVRWEALYPKRRRPVRLPAYQWQRERFWHEAPECRAARLDAPAHPLLARDLASAQPCWEVKLDTRLLPWIKDHQIRGRVVFPAAAYLEMALTAGEILGVRPCVVEDLEIHKPLLPKEGDQASRVQFLYDPQDGSFRIHSRMENAQQPWTLLCLGKIRSDAGADGQTVRTAIGAKDIWDRLQDEISADEYYQCLLQLGLQYGPRFRGIKRIRFGDGEALAEVEVPTALQGELEDYRLHPALLDACLHLMPAAVRDLRDLRHASSNPLYLPFRIERMRFYGWPARAWCHVRLSQCDAKSARAEIRVIDDAGQPWVEIRGFHCEALTEPQSDAELDHGLYRWDWQLKALSSPQQIRRPADFLPNTLELGERLQIETAHLSSSLGWDQSWQHVVNDVCAAYIVQAFEQLGWQLRVGECVAEDTLLEKLRVGPSHERLVRRYLTVLAEEGLLRRIPQGLAGQPTSRTSAQVWEVVRPPDRVDIGQRWRMLAFEYSELYPELTLLERCGRNLAALLRGEADALELLMPDGSMWTLEHLYDSSRSCRVQNTTVQKAVSAAVEHLTEGRTLRILEIGGGTGGLTAHVLPKLPARRVEYVFTDVSMPFLSKAEQRFAAYPFVQYRLLDIERSPQDQGIGVGDFDLIVAANALHATADLRQVLGHVRQLLAPDGWLISMELVKPWRWFDIVFGLIEGLWRFADTDLRPSHPLLMLDQWQTLFAQAGFRDVAAISDISRAAECEQAVLLARGPCCSPSHNVLGATETPWASSSNSVTSNLQTDPGRWLLFADSGGLARRLADHLEAGGARCLLLNSEEELDKAFDRDDAPYRGIVHLWSLDIPGTLLSTAALDEAQERGCYTVVRLIQALSKCAQSPQLWLVTRGAQPAGEQTQPLCSAQSPVIGLGRVIISEHPHLRCRMVDLDAGPSNTDGDEARALFDEIWANEGEEEIALRGKARYVLRLERTSFQELRRTSQRKASGGRVTLEATPGVLEKVVLRQRLRKPPKSGEIEIEVAAAGLNFLDVLKALGMIRAAGPDGNFLGAECAGRIAAVGEGVAAFKPGDEVLAFGGDCQGSYVTTLESLVSRKPAHLSMEQAATIPLAFLTAAYALRDVGRIKPGERVLIHSAAGGVGLAAVQIAQLAGAEVFATAGSREKREYLQCLGVEHVMDSRSLDFGEKIMEATGGEGVDIVLNSLAGPAIAIGLSCLREYGRFVEIGKRDILGHTRVDLHPFRRNLSFSAIDLASALQARPSVIASTMRELVNQFEHRSLHPLPHRTFPITNAVPAMRHMAQARHVGKVVLTFQDHEGIGEHAYDGDALTFPEAGTYLISGGLGGFGLGVASWMVDSGARHLVLMGRSAASNEAQQALDVLKSSGAHVLVAQADVTSQEDVARVLSAIRDTMPPLRGVIHAAMVLDDALLLRMDSTRFRRVTAPKIHGAWNLHLQTLEAPLDFFVMFSSMNSVLGSPAQGNYAAGNAFLDALAHQRRAQGLPALTVNWGRLGDVGYSVQHPNLEDYFSRMGMEALPLKNATDILGRLLQSQVSQAAALRMDWGKLGRQVPTVKSSPRFAHLMEGPAETAQWEGRSARQAILAAPDGERHHLLESHLRETAAKVLGTSASKIPADLSLNELGMDSLMAIELSMRIEGDLGLTLPSRTGMGSYNVSRLASAVGDLLKAG